MIYYLTGRITTFLVCFLCHELNKRLQKTGCWAWSADEVIIDSACLVLTLCQALGCVCGGCECVRTLLATAFRAEPEHTSFPAHPSGSSIPFFTTLLSLRDRTVLNGLGSALWSLPYNLGVKMDCLQYCHCFWRSPPIHWRPGSYWQITCIAKLPFLLLIKCVCGWG